MVDLPLSAEYYVVHTCIDRFPYKLDLLLYRDLLNSILGSIRESSAEVLTAVAVVRGQCPTE